MEEHKQNVFNWLNLDCDKEYSFKLINVFEKRNTRCVSEEIIDGFLVTYYSRFDFMRYFESNYSDFLEYVL